MVVAAIWSERESTGEWFRAATICLTDDYHVRTIENATAETTGLQRTINLAWTPCAGGDVKEGESLGTPPDRVGRPVKEASRGGRWTFGPFGSVGKEVPDGLGWSMWASREPWGCFMGKVYVICRCSIAYCCSYCWIELLTNLLSDRIAFVCNCYIFSCLIYLSIPIATAANNNTFQWPTHSPNFAPRPSTAARTTSTIANTSWKLYTQP